jgi:hypothetical protein
MDFHSTGTHCMASKLSPFLLFSVGTFLLFLTTENEPHTFYIITALAKPLYVHFFRPVTFTSVEPAYYCTSVPNTSKVKTFLVVKIIILKYPLYTTALEVLRTFFAPHVKICSFTYSRISKHNSDMLVLCSIWWPGLVDAHNWWCLAVGFRGMPLSLGPSLKRHLRNTGYWFVLHILTNSTHNQCLFKHLFCSLIVM